MEVKNSRKMNDFSHSKGSPIFPKDKMISNSAIGANIQKGDPEWPDGAMGKGIIFGTGAGKMGDIQKGDALKRAHHEMGKTI